MPQKLKFKPVITRIKLNPEQAVLACSCYGSRLVWTRTGRRSAGTTICGPSGRAGVRRSYPTWSTSAGSAAIS